MIAQSRLLPYQGSRLIDDGLSLLATFPVMKQAVYSPIESDARKRLEQHCENSDWPSVALALVMNEATSGIWTEDRDYFCCGVAVWSSSVLQRVLG